MARDLLFQERVNELVRQGFGEAEALKRVRVSKEADGGTTAVSESSDDMVDDSEDVAARQFVIVTKDLSGLGWAKKLIEEGETVTVATQYSEEEDEENRKAMKQVGRGWVDVVELKDLPSFHGDSTYFVFGENCFVEEAEKLIKAGQKVFPPNIVLSEKMEHDRQYAVEVAEQAGLQSPPTYEFSTLDEAIRFLDENQDTAFVFKPDDGKFNYLTFVPSRREDADANRELYAYLSHMKEEPGGFILQERIPLKDALEVNVEVWLWEGDPFFATVGLELKRRDTGDLGEMCGCAADFIQVIPVDSPLVQQTVGKLLPFYKEQGYTGFADVNVIFTKDGEPYFLEVCNRFGYNAHVTYFLGLAKDGFGNIIADFTDGEIESIPERFRRDVGASVTLFIDHPRPGLPVNIDDTVVEQFYPFDGYMEDDQWLLTDYSNEVGIVCDHASTIEEAAKKVLKIVQSEKVAAPDAYYRVDIGASDYPNAPARRMAELKKRGLL